MLLLLECGGLQKHHNNLGGPKSASLQCVESWTEEVSQFQQEYS